MIDEIEFGKFINQLRIEAGLTQDELAKKVGVSSGKIISKWENGNNMPDIFTLKKIAMALNVTVYELLECKRLKKKSYIDATKDFIKSSKDIFKLNIIGKVTIIVAILLGIFFGICTIFTLDTYGTVEIYTFKSLDDNFSINGNMVLTKDYSFFDLIKIGYTVENKNLNNKAYKIEYKILNGYNTTIISYSDRLMTNGDRKDFNLLDNINNCRFNLLIDNHIKEELKTNKNNTFILQIAYEDKDKQVNTIEFPFKIVKKYQNIF